MILRSLVSEDPGLGQRGTRTPPVVVQQRCNRASEYNRLQKKLAYALVIYEYRGGFAVFDTRVLEGDIHIAGHRHKSRFSEALTDQNGRSSKPPGEH